jgi:hypothetical protein
MLVAHANADARADFIPCNGRPQKFLAVHAALGLNDCHKRWQRYRAYMQNTATMDVIQFEPLGQRTVYECCMGGRSALFRSPYAALIGVIQSGYGFHQNLGPFQMRRVKRATEGIQN